ncbi:hypothetical protein IJI89_01045 [Candidatus Saccharibacteria bacterium]|nr:hypothetical protein [Candidatus Saccharibacteria bacterium]
MAEEKPTKKPDKKPEEAKKPAEAPKETKEEKPAEKPVEKTTKPAEEREKKSKKGLIFGFIFGGLAIVAGVLLAIFLPKGSGDPSDPKNALNYSSAFSIQDDGKYTIWNKSGEKVSEEEYDYISSFIAGYAYARKDTQVGVIRDNGGVAIEFGRYGELTQRGGLFLAKDGNTKKNYVVTGDGRVLLEGETISLRTSYSSSAFALAETPDKIYAFNHDGKTLAEMEVKEDASSARLDSSNDFGAVYYNNRNIIFDARSGNILADFEGDRFTIDEVSNDRSKVLLENSENSNSYKLIANGRVYDLDETKYYSFTTLNDVIGYDDYSEIALLDNDFKVARKVSSYVILKDYNNFAAETDDDKVEIYRNGEVIKTFEEDASSLSGVMYEDYYAISNNGKWKFYTLDGNEAFGGKEWDDIDTLFDRHHHAVVAEEEGKYYLIDAGGNRIGDGETTYRRIYANKGGYEVRNTDAEYSILDKNGKPLENAKWYDSVSYRTNPVDHNIWTGKNDYSDFDVIDVDTGKVLLEHANTQTFYANYFTVKNDDNKLEYYTYEGKLFFTATK